MEKSIFQERTPKTASGGGEADAVPGRWRGGAPPRARLRWPASVVTAGKGGQALMPGPSQAGTGGPGAG